MPAPNEDMEVIAPPKDGTCKMRRFCRSPRGGLPRDPGRAPPSPRKRARPSAGVSVQFIFILEQVLNGLLVGAYYLLIALGLSLIFSLGGIVNLAHGGFYAIGAYLAVI